MQKIQIQCKNKHYIFEDLTDAPEQLTELYF